MKYSIILISFFLLSTVVQAEVYKYTNKQGKTAYSDTPVIGAEKVIVPPVMTYQPPAILKNTRAVEPKEKLIEKQVNYEYLSVISPIEQGTIRSNQGIVNVTYDLQPALQKGDRVQLLLDGRIQEGFNIQGLERGEHVVQVQVVDENGNVKISSSSVIFYLQRHSKR